MTLTAHLLVVDDDASQREQLAGFLRDLGAEVLEAGDGAEALEILRGTRVELVITDLRMPVMDGRELLREIKALNPEIGVLVVTAFGTVEGAVACLKDGAADYLMKPLDLDEVEILVRRAIGEVRLRSENRELRRRLGALESVPGIVTAGGAMAEALSTVVRVAASEVSVLILGESGTGKELIARAIHQASPRKDGPFVAVNGAALSASLLESELFGHVRGAFTGAEEGRVGRFEAAGGGTLFLDEVGDLPVQTQIKLLRVLQERCVERVGANESLPIDVRLIAATHRDLLAEVEAGRFREDFYYRLAVVSVEIPPLRLRRADIPLLVEHFLGRLAELAGVEAKSISREAMDLLVRYDFPGNVRELENIVQHCLVLARDGQITTDDLPATVLGSRSEAGGQPATASLPARVAALEQAAIEEALVQADGNQSRAAASLGISERALRYKLAKIRKSD